MKIRCKIQYKPKRPANIVRTETIMMKNYVHKQFEPINHTREGIKKETWMRPIDMVLDSGKWVSCSRKPTLRLAVI